MCKFLSNIFRKKSSTSNLLLGVVVHILDENVIKILLSLGIKNIRWTYYMHTDELLLQNVITLCVINYIDLLVVLNGLDGISANQISKFIFKYPSTLFQIGNEPDINGINSSNTSPEYVGRYIRAVRDFQSNVVSPGISNNASAEWINTSIENGLISSQSLCLHAYGSSKSIDLNVAIINRIKDVSVSKIWITEFGSKSVNEKIQSSDIDIGVQAMKKFPVIEKAYCYALYSPDDGYGIIKENYRQTLACSTIKKYI